MENISRIEKQFIQKQYNIFDKKLSKKLDEITTLLNEHTSASEYRMAPDNKHFIENIHREILDWMTEKDDSAGGQMKSSAPFVAWCLEKFSNKFFKLFN